MVGGIKRLTVQRLCHGCSIGTVRGGCRGGKELPSGWVFICSSTVGKLVREGSWQRGRPVFIRVELITKQTNRANPVSIRSMEFLSNATSISLSI